jgi:hypothetical protein
MKYTTQVKYKLAKEVQKFLADNDLWNDTCIYVNHERWSNCDENGHYHYGDSKYYVENNIDPKDYFEYVNEPNILSMSFDGEASLYYDVNYYRRNIKESDKIVCALSNILDKYGLYYELGDSWNLSCYPLEYQ